MLPQAFPLLRGITLWQDTWLRPPCTEWQGHSEEPRSGQVSPAYMRASEVIVCPWCRRGGAHPSLVEDCG